MPRKNLIQTDFLAGEISPRMELQDNLEGRKHSAEFIQNWIIHLQGTVETSRGYEWVLDIPGSYGRAFGFPISLFSGFVVVVTFDKVYITDQVGFVQDNSLVVNGDFNALGAGWLTTEIGAANVLFLNGVVILTPGSNPSQIVAIRQGVPVVIGNLHTVVVQVTEGDGPVTVNVGSAEGLSDIASVTQASESAIIIEDLASTTVEMWIECIVTNPAPAKSLNSVQCYDTTVAPEFAEFDSPWPTRTDIGPIQVVMSPSELAMYFTSPGVIPHRLHYDTSTTTWSFDPIPFVSPPAEWAISNYPSAIGFFGGRLYLGGVLSDPAIFWGSKSNDFFNFTLGELADDAIEHRLNKRGAIRWIMGGQSLLIGTENSEHVVSSEGSIIIPGDINSLVQSSNGSWPAQALEVGNEVLYISPDGRKIRSIGYEWSKDAWRSKDLTYASEHITGEGNALTHIHYAANPDSIILGTTFLGTIVNCTYEPFTQTVGFSRRSTEGNIVSATCLPFAGIDETWVLVDRGGGVLSLEKEHLDHNVKLDSHEHFVSGAPISEISSPHLAGKTCQVLVDGAVHSDVIPSVPDGDVTLEFAGFEIIIGLAIDSILVTLPVADTIPNVGTTRSMKKNFFEIWVRILDSWRPKINGHRTPNRRVPTPMGEVEPARTESVQVANVGWDMEAKITIEQDLPLTTEMAGVFGRINQEEV